ALMSGGLPVQVEFRGPPGFSSVFQLDQVVQKTVAAIGARGHVGERNLQVARLLHVVRVSDEVRAVARAQQRSSQQEKPGAVPRRVRVFLKIAASHGSFLLENRGRPTVE